MTLDQSLANLQHQADRLAGIFEATADAIQNEGHPYVGSDPVAAYAKGVSDAMAGTPTRSEPVEVLAKGYVDPVEAAERFVESQALPADWAGRPWQGEPGEQHPLDSTRLPMTPQGAAPSDGPTAPPTAAVVEVEGPDVAPSETPRPAAPNPFEAEQPAAAAPAEKKKGRRTHEELAADNNVRLEDVKAWLGDKKVTKAAIEEYASLAVAPAQAAAPLPTAAADPFGNPGPAPVQNNTGVAEPVVAQAPPPAPQQVAPQPTPSDPFAQGAGNPWDGDAVQEWSPFE